MTKPISIAPVSGGSVPTRYPGLDWLRVAGCLMVVAFHAGIPYMASPLPNMKWCIDERTARSDVVDATGWGIDACVMPLFFLIAGFLACQSCRKSGAGNFIHQRSVRIGIPLAIAFTLVMPAVLYIWLFGWLCEGRVTPEQLRRLELEPGLMAQLQSPGHLWFLFYLWLFCGGAALVAALRNRWRAGRSDREDGTQPISSSRGWHLGRAAAVAALFGVSVAGLLWDPLVVIGFRPAPVPQLPNILYYAPCFVLGWLLRQWNWAPGRWTGLALLTSTAVLFPGLWRMISLHVAAPRAGMELLPLVTTFTACGWLATVGLLACGIRYSGGVPPWVRYLSQASLWIYLAHVPPLALAQISLRVIEGYGAVKALVSAVVGLVCCLAFYEFLVRGQRLDTLMNGRAEVSAKVPTERA